MKKIGLLTYHHVINYGAVLQTYAQAKILQSYFKDSVVEIIDYRSKVIERKEFVSHFLSCIKNFTLKPVKKYFNIKNFINKELPLSKDKFVSDNYKKSLNFINNKYDAVFVGSDEVWKSMAKGSSRQFPNIYFLSPKLKCKKIGLAASANKCFLDIISPENKKIGKKLLNGFDFISVRDTHTLELLKSLGVNNKRIYKIPDPTLACDFNFINANKIKRKLKKIGVDFKKPIVCIRMDIGISNKKRHQFFSKLRDYFINRGFQIVSVGNNKFADIDISDCLNPIEWAEVDKLFDFTITDRFHGTIFSLKNNTPFLVVEDNVKYKRMRSKIADLLEELSMEHHYLYLDDNDYNIREIVENIENNFSNKEVEKKLKKMRDKYYDVLGKVEV